MGKGNKPNAADPITDEEIELLYEKRILGKNTPKSLLNTIWLNNCHARYSRNNRKLQYEVNE